MAATDNRAGSMPQPYPNLPASPTLTNPDMILPDYDLSPGLDDHDDHHDLHDQSTLMMWKNAHAAASSADLQQLFASGPLSGNMSGPLSGPLSSSLSAQDHHNYSSGPITPTTPIIYGNGTMLSDIGEVTEAESTPGRASPTYGRHIGGYNDSSNGGLRSRSPSPTPLAQSLRHQFNHNHHAITSRESLGGTPRRSSPTMGPDDGLGGSSGGERSGDRTVGIKERARQQQDRMRRDSIESNSTITTEDRAGLFADFDDAASVGDDSVFQGDDEESVAESYVDETYLARQVPIANANAAAASMLSAAASSGHLAVPDFGTAGASSSGGNTSDEGDRRLSAASLSLRAEQILANAKKRLTTMEGNLSRARSSLYVTSPSLGSLPSDGSTPPITPIRSATASSRYHDPTPGSPIHARMASDGSMPVDGVAGANGVGSAVSATGFPQRSASALGAAGGYRQPTGIPADAYPDQERLEAMQDSLTGGYHRAGLSRPVDIVLERLDETSAVPTHDTRNAVAADDVVSPAARSGSQLDSYLSPTYSSYSNGTSGSGASDKGLSRSGSVVQMRDLKDQVKDLKGKISSLREQARVDSLKRRSMQSLRTPSPFTHSQVDQWYAEAQPPQPSQPQQQQNGASTPQPSQDVPASAPQQQPPNGASGHNLWNGELESVDVDANPVASSQQQPPAYAEESRDMVTPPAQMTDYQAGARPVTSNGSGSGYSGQSQRTTPTQLTADKTDQDSFMSKDEEPAENATSLSHPARYNNSNGEATPLPYTAYSGMAKRYAAGSHPDQLAESPVLGDLHRDTPGEATPTAARFRGRTGREGAAAEEDDDHLSDDVHTENGDFADASDTYQQQQQQQPPPPLDDVFVDAIDVDEIYDPAEEEQQFADREYNDDYANDGYESESGESLYHDTLQHPISHEDREDAFDYEHFILHSALGTISQQRLARGRSGSFSSEGSVETTRGPSTSQTADAGASSSSSSSSSYSAAHDANGRGRGAYPSKSPSRRTSMISIATIESVDSMESFATATEGRSSRVSRMSRNSRINLMSPHESSFEDVAEDSFEDMEDTTSSYNGYSNRSSMIANHNYPPIPSMAAAAVAAAKDRPDSVVLARAAAASSHAASSASGAGAAPVLTNPHATSYVPASVAGKRNSTEELRQTQKPYMARRPASSAAMPSHRPSVSSFESTGTTRSFPLVNRNRVGSLNAISGAAGYPSYRSASNNGSSSPGSSEPTPTPTQGHRATLSASDSSRAPSQTPSQTSLRMQAQSQAQLSDDDAELRSISETLMNETASVCEQQLQQQDGASDSAQSQSQSQTQAQTLQALAKDDQYLVERLVANLGRCVLGLSESGRASTESRVYRRRIDAARRILEGLDSA